MFDITQYREIAKRIVRHYYKDDAGKPFEMSNGQADIFNCIFLKDVIIAAGYNRVQIIAPTQYGKSTVIAMALNLRSQSFSEDWGILTGQQKKSDIIMEKLIQHLFDDKNLYSQLEVDKNEPLDRIRRERSKQKMNWLCGGSVRTYTASASNTKRMNDSLSGQGIPNIVEDEASLIQDPLQSMVLRMLGGHNGGYLVKIGNPYTRGHFLKTSRSSKYLQIFIDYKQALSEGRYTEEFIQEMRGEAFFDILYECKFPSDSEIDRDGFYRLLSDEKIASSKEKVDHEGTLRLGFDVGEGGDENCGVLRSGSFAEKVHFSKYTDLMAAVKVIKDLIKQYSLNPSNVFVDATGLGAGVVSRLHELELYVKGVKWASKPSLDKYLNLKAENYWEAKDWIEKGGKIDNDDGFNELSMIKYKEDSGGKLKIKSKEDMRKDGISSPNVADAFALTFNKSVEDSAPKIYST